MNQDYSGRVVFVVPLAYDYMQNKSGHGTIARCRALLDELKRDGVPSSQCVVILTGGYTAKSKTRPSARQTQSLAEQMRIYLEPYLRKAMFMVKPCAWGTQEEIRESGKVIEEYCKEHKIPLSQCIILTSSNRMHLRGRVALWWKQYVPKSTEAVVRYIEADHDFRPWERVQEFGKLVRDALRLITMTSWKSLRL